MALVCLLLPISAAAQDSGTVAAKPADTGEAADSSKAAERIEVLENKKDNKKMRTYAEKNWGLGMVIRTANIPWRAENGTVKDFLPLLYYDDENFFLRGWEGGVKITEYEKWRFNLLGRYRFFDIPAEFQNDVRGKGLDAGLLVQRPLTEIWNLNLEALTDVGGRPYARTGVFGQLGTDHWLLRPELHLRFKSSTYNNRYYGLGLEKPGAGVDLQADLEGRYHLWSNIFAIGRVGATLFEEGVRDLSIVDDGYQWEVSFGLAVFNNPDTPMKPVLPNNAYIRVAHGWATPSNIGDMVFKGEVEKDEFNNQLTSFFYGHPLVDELFGLPIDVYITPGFVWHHESDVQDSTQEYVLAIKLYYTIPLPWRVRLGVAEGLSYVDTIPFIEQREMDRKGYRASKLLNYLDFSLDVNVGDVFDSEPLKSLWLGYSLHHRSGIFESTGVFGRIRGGSNYNTVYLQWHY